MLRQTTDIMVGVGFWCRVRTSKPFLDDLRLKYGSCAVSV